MQQYEKYMKKCFKLAKQGLGSVSPNPLVGCVVLNSNGEIISTGFHEKYGENHAERKALLKLKNNEAENGTLIVNLEPCSHFGKTPPCADLIIQHKLKRVVIGMTDPNPLVAGAGIKKLKEAGIDVIEHILEDEALKLNEVFIKNIKEKKTFTAIKTAATLDGKTASKTGSSKWITSEKARAEVKKIRNKYDAILTSSSTIIADKPSMEHRKKIILDSGLKTDLNSKIYSQGQIFVFHSEKVKAPKAFPNIYFFPAPVINNKMDIEFVLKKLFELNIMSVLVEAGGKLNGSFLPFTDKIYHFIAPKVLSDNCGKSCFDGSNIIDINQSRNFTISSIEKFEPDILLTYYPI